MKRIISGLTILIFFTLSVSAGQNPRTVSNFNSRWNFHLGDVAKAFSSPDQLRYDNKSA